MRRRELSVALAAAGLVAAIGTARADFISAPDVVVFADPAVRAAMETLARQFHARSGVRVRVMSATGAGLVEQVARGARSDILVTRAAVMEAAEARALLQPGSRFTGWRTPLVLAARRDASRFVTLAGLPADARVALTDPTTASDIDGRAVIGRARLGEALDGRVVGVANVEDVCFLVERGAAALGLMTLAEVRAHPSLAAVATLGEPPLIYSAAITANLLSREAQHFHDFLRTEAAANALNSAGLEAVS